MAWPMAGDKVSGDASNDVNDGAESERSVCCKAPVTAGLALSMTNSR